MDQKYFSSIVPIHGLVTARINGQLVGLANAISDGSLGVYFPHLLVGLDWQRQGIGRRIMQSMLQYYSGFHQQILVADQQTIGFYQVLGFMRAGLTKAM